MDDPESAGGQEGGAPSRNPDRLRPSELALLRRMMSRYPLTQEDRIKAVGRVNDIIADDTAGVRAWLAAIKAMLGMEKINVAELIALIASQKIDVPATVTTNLNVYAINLTPAERVVRLASLLAPTGDEPPPGVPDAGATGGSGSTAPGA